MNKKEVLEIKKQFSPVNCGITRIAGCFVNLDKEIVSTFRKAFLSLNEEEMFSYLDLFKKGLSGRIGQKLLNVEFPVKEKNEKADSLKALRDSKLTDAKILEKFFREIVESYRYSESYVILLIHGVYDIPGKADAVLGRAFDASEDVYEHIMCCICPVSLDKASLAYNNNKNDIEYKVRNQLIQVPATAFLYPAFDDRTANLHAMLYYTKKSSEIHPEFLESMFDVVTVHSAEDQKTAVAAALETVDVSMQNLILLKEEKENMKKDLAETVKLNAKEMEKLCQKCEIEADGLSTILNKEGINEVIMDNIFSDDKTTIRTDNIRIQLKNDVLDKIEVRKIDGVNCILIHPDGRIHIDDIPVREE